MFKKVINSLFGVNITGYIKGEFGLGEGARANIRSIKTTNVPYVISNLTTDWHRNLDSTFSEEEFTTDNPYAINLLNFNAEATPDFLEKVSSQYLENKYNIGFWAWELPTFPAGWQHLFDFYDEIWTYSSHCAEAISAVSPVPVVKMMPSLDLPQPSIGREAFSIPKNQFMFLFMFDFHSTFARKNPVATIEAFKQAFGNSNQDVLLVIKFSNGEKYPKQLEQLRNLAANNPSIRLIEGHLSREKVNALVHCCDCYVSLHRAEGFGLTMAEAMFYGKPVIATGYSSNTEFMNIGNSFLVSYELVEITEDHEPYKKGDLWAQADISHAASLMYYVFHNYPQAQQVGARAAREIKSKLHPFVTGKRIENRLKHVMSKIENNSIYQVNNTQHI